MARLIALYSPPADPVAFDDYYRRVHIPIARTIPGVRRVEISSGPVVTPQGPSSYHKVGILEFDSLADLQTGLGSPEGQATAADLANFAAAGVTILVFDAEQP